MSNSFERVSRSMYGICYCVEIVLIIRVYKNLRLDGYRARQSLVGLSAHCANSYIPHVQHIIQYICAAGCRNLHSVHSVQLNSV